MTVPEVVLMVIIVVPAVLILLKTLLGLYKLAAHDEYEPVPGEIDPDGK